MIESVDYDSTWPARFATWQARIGDHLRFRDVLRADADARERYAAAERGAAARWADDGIAYTDAKSAVILSILAGTT